MDPRTPWERTYEGRAEKAAHSNRMNYFLPVAYNDIALKKRIKAELTSASLQVLIVLPADDYWQEYITSCLNAFLNAGENQTRTSLSMYLKSRIEHMITYAESLDDEIQVAYVSKTSNRFKLDQLLKIARFVGAIKRNDVPLDYMDTLAMHNIEYLSECNISMSSSFLKSKIANARAIISSLSPTGDGNE